jgi:hypothetical protein
VLRPERPDHVPGAFPRGLRQLVEEGLAEPEGDEEILVWRGGGGDRVGRRDEDPVRATRFRLDEQPRQSRMVLRRHLGDAHQVTEPHPSDGEPHGA